jgi:3-dehydroquinate synthase II
VKIDPWDKKLVTTALESGAHALWVPAGRVQEVKALGQIQVIAPDGDLIPGQDVQEVTIAGGEQEEEVVRLARQGPVVVHTTDWTVIPLENLVARSGNLFVEVSEVEAARTALGVLEKGVDGLVVVEANVQLIKDIARLIRESSPPVELATALISRIRPLAMGDRVCVDTCTNMGLGEGMLVGNSSQALFLVHSESVENPFVNTRPFRVNAGPVHAYIRLTHGQTKYLSEVRSGDQVLVVNFEGKSYPAVVGRAKVEKRPLVLVEAEEKGQNISVILQNAETIRLTQPDGKAVSLVDLKEGSEVLVYREGWARHFGAKIDETIIER